MAREFPKLIRLDEVTADNYKSRDGAYVKLRFEGPRFVLVHNAEIEDYDHWLAQVGTYHWVAGRWELGPCSTIEYRTYWLVK